MILKPLQGSLQSQRGHRARANLLVLRIRRLQAHPPACTGPRTFTGIYITSLRLRATAVATPNIRPKKPSIAHEPSR